jgi:hypothetical protein
MKRCLILTATTVLAITGCLPHETTTRSQAADEPSDPETVAVIGQKTVVGNAEPITVSGVGLVYNLQGTGSSPPPGDLRTHLENAILKRKGRPKELLDDPGKSTSLVLVSGMIPPGARRGERIEVTITLPPGSKTTSLKGGILFPCDLQNYELVGSIREQMSASGVPAGKIPLSNSETLAGHRLAVAEGPVIAGAVVTSGVGQASRESDGGEEPLPLRVGKVWEGGRVLLDRPYYFLLNDATPQPRMALVVAERLNTVFHAVGDPGGKIADAKVQGRPLVVATVPAAYRWNHTRFLLVARQIPLLPIDLNHPYRRQLEHELLRPEKALSAAIKLEALGADSRQALRVGLQSDSPWVRFAAAEALAYLGHPDGAKDLAELAAAHPALRSHCLTALASLDDAVSTDLLAELMKHPEPELRYGAFVALRMADPRHAAVRGRQVNGSFWLHRAVPEGDGLVHIASLRKSEIVLFGTGHPMRTPFSFPIGNDFTVTARGDDSNITVTRIARREGEPVAISETCPADLGAVLVALSKLGGTYSEAVELVMRAQRAEVLAAAVAYDALPRGIPIQQLAQISRNDPHLARADREVERYQRGEVVPAGYDLPTEGQSVQQPAAPVEAVPLNREPGRLFGPKRPGVDLDDNSPPLNREPGRLFGK